MSLHKATGLHSFRSHLGSCFQLLIGRRHPARAAALQTRVGQVLHEGDATTMSDHNIWWGKVLPEGDGAEDKFLMYHLLESCF